jgi:hypothetical protein
MTKCHAIDDEDHDNLLIVNKIEWNILMNLFAFIIKFIYIIQTTFIY